MSGIPSLIERSRRILLPGTASPGASSGGHASQRNRRVALSGSTAVIARVIQIGTSLVTVPLTLKYLGNERFGLWMRKPMSLKVGSKSNPRVKRGSRNSTGDS